jgi:hypothetical protein
MTTKVDCLCTAELSDCGAFRYELRRIWDDTKRLIVFVMLNPSKADASRSDRTIDKLIRLAHRWGCGGFIVVNLYAYRTDDPKVLAEQGWLVGPENDRWITKACGGRHVVCAWGSNAAGMSRETEVRKLIRAAAAKTWAIKINKDHTPAHPLYLREDMPMVEYAA